MQKLSFNIGFNFCGEWENTKIYSKNDIVRYDGSLFLAVRQSTVGEVPIAGSTWSVFWGSEKTVIASNHKFDFDSTNKGGTSFIESALSAQRLNAPPCAENGTICSGVLDVKNYSTFCIQTYTVWQKGIYQGYIYSRGCDGGVWSDWRLGSINLKASAPFAPSARRTLLALTNGATYIADSDGYFSVKVVATAVSHGLFVTNTKNQLYSAAYSTLINGEMTAIMPAAKGDGVKVVFNVAGSGSFIAFVHATSWDNRG